MPTSPFMQIGGTPRKMTGDASDHTRYLRMAAQVAPYIKSGTSAAPTLGWKVPSLSTEARLVAPVFGIVRAFIPSAK